MGRQIKIAPSILSADFSQLAEEVQKVEEAGANLVHIDVMDGHFVPNITVGPLVVEAIRPKTKLPLDIHLMIERPEHYVERFANAGSDIITVHIEAFKQSPVTSHQSPVREVLRDIKSLGLKAGVSLNPDTLLSSIEGLLEDVDMVLVMSVNPGFAGQSFMKSVVPKIKALHHIFERDIEVDGGINEKTAKEVLEAGANILVAGTYIFGSDDYREAIRRLRGV